MARRRIRIGFVLLGTVGSVVGLVSIALCGFAGFLKTDGGNAWLTSKVDAALDGLVTDGEIVIGAIHTDLWGHFRFEDVQLKADDGTVVVRVGRAAVDLSPLGLLRRTLSEPVVVVDDVELDLRTRADGTLEISHLLGGPSEPTGEPSKGFPLAVKDGLLTANGVSLVMTDAEGEVTFSASGLALTTRVEGKGKTFRFDDLDLGGVLVSPGPGSVSAQGRVFTAADQVWFDDLEIALPGSIVRVSGGFGDHAQLHATLAPLDLGRIDPLVGSVGLTGVWEGELLVTGPMRALRVSGHLADTAGASGGLILDATLDLEADVLTWKGDASFETFRLDGAFPAAGKVLLDGHLTFDGRGVRWPDDLTVDAQFSGGPVIVGEQALDSLNADVHVEDGKIVVEEATVDGIAGRLAISGEVDIEGGPMDLVVSGTLDAKRLAQLGLNGVGTNGVVDARVIGNLKEEGAPIRVDGSVVWAPFIYTKDVRFDRVTGRFHVDVRDGITTGTARVDTTAGVAYGVGVLDTSTPDIRFRVAGDVTTLSGTTRANAVHFPNVLQSDYADVAWTAQIGPTVSATASVDLGEHDLLGFPGDVGHAEVVVGAEKVDFDVALSSGERDAWRIEGDYRLADGTMTFDTLALAPTPRATWNAAPGAHLRIADGGIRDAAIALEGNLGRVELTGDLTQQGVMDGRLQLSAFQADSIAELFPDRFSGLAGLVNLDVTVKGRASSPVINGTIDARGVWWGEAVRWLDLAGTIRGEGDRLTVDLAAGVAGDPLAEIHGYLPVHLDLAKPGLDTDGEVAIDVDLLPGELVRVGLLVPAAEGSVPQGRASASLSVRGRMGDPDIRLAGIAELPITGWRKLGRVEFDVTRTREKAVVQIDALDGLVPVGSISGTGTTRIGEVFAWVLESAPEPDLEDYGMYLDDLDMTVGLSGLPVERLASAAGSTVRLRGSLLGGFVVTGSPWAPVVEGGVQWLDPVVGHQKLEGAFVSLLPSETGYATDLELAFARGGGLRIAGDVGVKPDFRRPFEEWVEGDLDLEISGPGVPLGIVGAFVPGVRGAKARVVVQGTVKGTPLHPDPLIDAAITDGYVEIDALGLKLEDIDLAITAVNRRVTLEASLYPEPLQRIIGIGETAESSRITAKGSMQLVGGMPDAVSVVIKLENGAWVAAMPDAMLRMEGDLSATGRWPALEVGGDLAVHTGRLALDAASFAEAAPLTPDPRLSIARGDLPVAEAVVVGPSIFDEIVVDIDLALSRNLDLQWSMAFAEDFGSLGAAVSRLDLDARLGGSIDLELERGTPTIVGEVEVVQGDLRILRSAFDLQAGSIVFTGGDPFEPNLDLSAEMTVPGATVEVVVSGTPSAPKVEFSSPDIQDEAAILTVLITGAPPEELTSNQGEAAAEAVAGLLLNSVLAGTNLGNLSIDPNGSVTVGLPVSQRIYAESLFKPGATVDENVIALKVEWTMFPRLVLSAALGDYESTSDVYWQVKF